jgi:membrane-bound serine protease (ClpP class)
MHLLKSRFPLFLVALFAVSASLLAAIKPAEPGAAGEKTAAPAEPKSQEAAEKTEPKTLPPPAVIATSDGPTYVFPLKGPVDQVQLMFMRRTLKEAEKAGAGAFLIDMDTPGGRLDVTMEILEMLRKTKVPTITYINPSAGSAGALISLGTKKIYMRKDAVIGAAAVITGQGEDLQKSMKQKVDSFYTAKMRAVAEENGHNPDIAEAFMVTEKEVKLGDTIVDSKETLLSLNGSEAVRKYDGRPLLAAGLAESVEEVLKNQGFSGAISRVEATGFETVALWLTTISPILLLIAIVGAYIEMKAPGFGIPGIVSLICFGLFFLGHYIAALSGMEAAVIFVIGAILVIIEIFLLPGMIIPGMLGAVLVLGSVLWAMVDHWPSQPGSLGAVDFERPMLNLLVAIGGAAVFAGIIARLLPKTSFYQRLVLSPANAAPTSAERLSPVARVGDTGVALTTLRPAGKAAFGETYLDVVSDGGYVEAGSQIRVVHVEGVKVVVEAIA